MRLASATNRFRAIFLAAMLVVATACQRDRKAEQLAALDRLYQAGLLTKDEYDAKRLAFTGAVPAPALPPVTPPAAAPSASTAPTQSLVTPSAPPHRADASANGSAKPKAKKPDSDCEDAEYKTGGKATEARFFAVSPEAVRRAAVSALDGLDFNIHRNSSQEIEASKKRHIGVIVGAGGERVILTFEKTEQGGQSGTRVVAETKKNFVGHVAQKTWTEAVLAQIGCRVREPSR